LLADAWLKSPEFIAKYDFPALGRVEGRWDEGKTDTAIASLANSA